MYIKTIDQKIKQTIHDLDRQTDSRLIRHLGQLDITRYRHIQSNPRLGRNSSKCQEQTEGPSSNKHLIKNTTKGLHQSL